jgi:hypothetical protein
MGVRKLWFPILLAVLWVLMTAMAMVDFADFSATTQPPQRAEQPIRNSLRVQGRSVRVAMR